VSREKLGIVGKSKRGEKLSCSCCGGEEGAAVSAPQGERQEKGGIDETRERFFWLPWTMEGREGV